MTIKLRHVPETPYGKEGIGEARQDARGFHEAVSERERIVGRRRAEDKFKMEHLKGRMKRMHFKRIRFTKPLALLTSVGLFVTGVGAGSALAATSGAATASGTLTTTAPTGYVASADWNPFSPGSTVMTAVGVIAFSPLAIVSNTNRNLGNYYYGQLASSWGYTDNYHQFVVHLRPNLKWNNGTALTSQDVLVSWELYGLEGVWNSLGITSITTPDTNTIVFHFDPTTLFLATREQTILTQVIVPASLYQKFLPSPQEFQQIIQNQEHPLPASASKAATAKATQIGTLDTNLVKALQAYNPGQSGLVTAGPYEVTGFSPSEVDLQKNPYNWAAANVHVENVVMRNSVSSTAIQNALVSGAIDVAGNAPTTPLYNAIMNRNKPYMHYFHQKGFLTLQGTMFSARVYPFNLIQVRQAFEYLLNRKAINTIADPVAGQPVAIPAGVPDSVLQAYLTPAQIKTLNPYNYSPAKAAQLLRSAHFVQKGGKWYLPNGKPFTVTVSSVAGLASWDLQASTVASELTQFGIPSQVQLWPVTSFAANLFTGNYSVFEGYNFFWPFQVWNGFTARFQAFGSDLSYSATGQPVIADGRPGMSYPWKTYVPGVGTINPMRLSWEFAHTPNVAKQKRFAYELIKFMNYNAWPGSIFAQDQSDFYSTKRFTDWPIHRSFWTLAGNGSGNAMIAVAEEQGYIRPVKG